MRWLDCRICIVVVGLSACGGRALGTSRDGSTSDGAVDSAPNVGADLLTPTEDDGAVASAPDVGVDRLTAPGNDGRADAVAVADIGTRPYVEVSRHGGRGSCPRVGTAASVVVRRGEEGSFYLSGEAFRAAPEGTTECAGYDYSIVPQACVTTRTFAETKLTPVDSGRLESLVAAMPPGKCTSDGQYDPCVLATLTVDGVSDTDWERGCREAAGPGTHLDGMRSIVAFIDSLVPPEKQ